MKKCIFFIIIMWFVSFVAFAQSASSAGNILFILDGSGSMWGQVEGRHKIVIAKEVMTGLVRELPDDIRAGLQVYGHRSRGDCDDIEMLVPVGSRDRQALIRQIESIMPRGKTPITQSFRQAADQLRSLEDETTVVLVSDGKETCEGDPCTLVRELREQGIRIKVHVVGFDVTHDESEQLVCIADAGGGQYFSAENAIELTKALEEVKQEVIVQSESVVPAPAAETVSALVDENTLIVGVGRVKLQALLGPNGAPLGGRESGMWTIFEGQADFQGNRKQVAMYHEAQPIVTLNAGDYRLRVKYGDAAKWIDLLVRPDAADQGKVVIGAGQVRLRAQLGSDSPPLDGRESGLWTILEGQADFQGNRKQVAMHHEAQPIVTLNAGDYRLRVKYGNAVKWVDLAVAAGEQKTVDTVIDAGQVKLQALLGPNGAPLGGRESGMWTIFEGQADFQGNRKQVAMHHEAQPIVTLNAGEYLVQLKVGSMKRSATLELAAGEQRIFAFEPE